MNPPNQGSGAGSGKALSAAAEQAEAAGRPAPVAALTTATDTVVADPRGGFTLTENVLPVRVRRGGGWVAVSTDLLRNADGSLSPAAVPGDAVRFSGGGSGPLASISAAGTSLALSWPGLLPAPVISGSSATYQNVLPGVDLVVTATSLQAGGFSEVLVVHSAAAARNLARLRPGFGVQARGVRLSAVAGGGLVASGSRASGYYTAAAPLMWDSSAEPVTTNGPAAAAAARAARGVGAGLAPLGLGGPLSSPAGPAAGARLARVAASVSRDGSTLSLAPDAAMLASPSTRWPVYIDPSFSWHTADGGRQDYDEVQEACPDASHYDNSYWSLGVGYDDWPPGDCNGNAGHAMDYYQVAVPSQIWGAHLNSATVNAQEAYTASCSASADVTLSWTDGMNSGTDWSNAPGLIAQQSVVDVGPNTTQINGSYVNCDSTYDTDPSTFVGVGFSVLPAMTQAAAGHWTGFTFRLWENGNNDDLDWKRFGVNPYLQIQYSHTPNVPSGLQISTTGAPGAPCANSPYPWVGQLASTDAVTMSAQVSDPDGDQLQGQFEYKVDGSSTWTPVTSTSTNVASGGRATATIPATWTNAQQDGTEVDWQVAANNGGPASSGPTSAESAECHFYIESSTPPAPSVSPGFTGNPAAGSPVSFTITSNNAAADPATEFVWGVDNQPSNTNPLVSQTVSWNSAGFDDSSWANAFSAGAYGISPWGTTLTGGPPYTSADDWIWNTAGSASSAAAGTIYLRKTFVTPAFIVHSGAILSINADNSEVTYVNGVQVASGTNWQTVENVNITNDLSPVGQENVIAVAATNTAAGPAGVIAQVDIDTTGNPEQIGTDTTWKVWPPSTANPPVAASPPTQTSAVVTVTVPGPGPHAFYVYTRDAAGNDSQMFGTADPAAFTAAADPNVTYSSWPAALDAGQSFDNTMISSTSGASCGRTTGDGQGDNFDATDLTQAGWEPGGTVTVDGATFTLPDFGSCGADNLLAANQTISLPAGSEGSSLVFLAAANNGLAAASQASDLPAAPEATAPFVPANTPVTGYECYGYASANCQVPPGTITYADSSTAPYFLEVPDWVLGPTDISAVTLPHVDESGGQVSAPVKIYAFAIPLDPREPLASVTLPDVGSVDLPGIPVLHILGLAVRNTTTATPQAGGVQAAAPSGQGWTGAFEAPVEAAYGPSSGAWANQTVRVAASPNISVPKDALVRIRLSDPGFISDNGTGPLVVSAASIAEQSSLYSPQPASGTMTALTFGGSTSVTVPEGGDIYSDPVPLPFAVTAGQNLLVSLYLQNSPMPSLPANSDPGGASTWFAAENSGNNATDTTGSPFSASGSGYYVGTYVLTGIDVTTPAASIGGVASPGAPTVVVSADGLIDARAPGTTALYDYGAPSIRIPGQLASAGTSAGFGVVDAGIQSGQVLGGNGSGGVSLLSRLDRDILAEPDVGTVVIGDGLEDLLQGGSSSTILGALENTGYYELVTQLNAWGITVVFGTLTPCDGYAGTGSPADACSPTVDGNRTAVNGYLGGQTQTLLAPYVYVDDFSGAAGVNDPSSTTTPPEQELSNAAAPADFDSGDHVNLTADGYKALAGTILATQLTAAYPPSG
jgi:hypothetical protein